MDEFESLCAELQSLKEEVSSLRERKKYLMDQIEHLKCYLKLEDHQIAEQNEMASKLLSRERKENTNLKKMIKELTEEALCLKAISESMYRKLTDDNGCDSD